MQRETTPIVEILKSCYHATTAKKDQPGKVISIIPKTFTVMHSSLVLLTPLDRTTHAT